MPAVSERSQRFFGAELGRARRGERTLTGLPISKLREMARKPKGKRLPARAKARTTTRKRTVRRTARR